MRQILAPAIALIAAFAAHATAQTPVPKGQVPNQLTNACTLAEKAEATAFSLTPSQPTAGQSVTVKLTLKNKCPDGSNPLNLVWDISKNSQSLGGGTKQLAAGATAELSATWTAVAGTHYFYGGITNPEFESASARQNNTRDLTVTVATPTQTKALDYDDAANAGAQFADNRHSNPLGTCSKLGQFNAENTQMLLNGRTGVVFTADCSGGVAGGRADPEVFKNFTLKNGWTVKSVEPNIENNIKNTGKGGFNTVVTPSVGSNNPYTKYHVWADNGYYVYVRMVITIQGPAGTNPYQ